MNVKNRKNTVSPAIVMAGVAVLFLIAISVRKDLQASEISFGDVIKKSMAQEFSESLMQKFMPVYSWGQQGEQEKNWLLESRIAGVMPVYRYYRDVQAVDFTEENGNDNREDYIYGRNSESASN